MLKQLLLQFSFLPHLNESGDSQTNEEIPQVVCSAKPSMTSRDTLNRYLTIFKGIFLSSSSFTIHKNENSQWNLNRRC